jgi:ribosomal protein S27AE
MEKAIQKKPDSLRHTAWCNYFTMVGQTLVAKTLAGKNLVGKTRECPRCGQSYLFRSHRRLMEKMLLTLLGWRPYRCGTCDFRFYLEAKPDPAERVTAASLVHSESPR